MDRELSAHLILAFLLFMGSILINLIVMISSCNSSTQLSLRPHTLKGCELTIDSKLEDSESDRNQFKNQDSLISH